METLTKQALKTVLPQRLYTLIKKQFAGRQLKEWQEKGCPAPPPHIVKQLAIKEYQKKSGYQILIETGTYEGDMIEAQKKTFRKIYSIELATEFFRNAQKRFRQDAHVELLQGDSGKVLPELMKRIEEPVIFWLDGHYSSGETAKGDKECPIFEELDAIFLSKPLRHVMMIDDARCFTGEADYPTLDELKAFVKSKNRNYVVEVKDDIIRLTA